MTTDQKTLILSSAAELFWKQGIRSTTIDDICGALRISKKTLYNHFKHKEDIISDMLVMMRCKTSATDVTVDASMNAIDKLILAQKLIRKDASKNKLNLSYELAKYYPAIYEKHMKETDKIIAGKCRETIQEGIDEGLFREDIEIEMFVTFFIVQTKYLVELIKEKTPLSFSKATDFAIDSFIRSAVNSKGLEYYLSKK